MRNEEAQQFRDFIQSTFEVFGTKTSADALTIWWNALAPYSLDQVRGALSEHVRTSVYPPKPADVIRAINAHDGRPGAEEAWGIALSASDEGATVVWTDEIATAKSACDEILSQGDEVGARMAFKERYEAEVREARAAQRPVHWRVSLGHDTDRRAQAIESALEHGRLTNEQAQNYLPAANAEPESVAGYLESDQPQMSEEQRQANLRELRALVAGAAPERRVASDSSIAETGRQAEENGPSIDEIARALEQKPEAHEPVQATAGE